MPVNHKPLNIEQISNALNCGKIYYFDAINSTNTWLTENGECGDICIGETQTAGRGRRGNLWESPRGNISFSLCHCFNNRTEHWPLLGLITGIAIVEALADIGITGHGIKWPNDIYWQGKKLGGILLETSDQSGKVVIGIGLNISLPINTHKKIEQEVTTLAEIIALNASSSFTRETLFIYLIKHLQNQFSTFNHLKFNEFIKLWKKWDILEGQTVSFQQQNKKVMGTVVKIDTQGRLGILENSGQISFHSSVDITLNKSNANT